MTDQPMPEAVRAIAEALHADVYPRDGRHQERNAAAVLAFIRDAIHRDGEDAEALREALGLEWMQGQSMNGRYRRVIGTEAHVVTSDEAHDMLRRRLMGEVQP